MRYLFSDRRGGFSKGSYSSFNLALHVNDNPLDVQRNRELLSDMIGTKNLVFMQQIHKDYIKVVDTKEPQTYSSCDALITNLKEVALVVMVADCIPVLFYDSKKEVIAAVHAGREGVKRKIAPKTVVKMRDLYGCKAKDIEVFIGASIKSCCYEIKSDVSDGFENYLHVKKDRIYLDLVSKCVDDLKSLGVENIDVDERCTCCNKNYFSYRRDGVTGRFAGVIRL